MSQDLPHANLISTNFIWSTSTKWKNFNVLEHSPCVLVVVLKWLLSHTRAKALSSNLQPHPCVFSVPKIIRSPLLLCCVSICVIIIKRLIQNKSHSQTIVTTTGARINQKYHVIHSLLFAPKVGGHVWVAQMHTSRPLSLFSVVSSVHVAKTISSSFISCSCCIFLIILYILVRQHFQYANDFTVFQFLFLCTGLAINFISVVYLIWIIQLFFTITTFHCCTIVSHSCLSYRFIIT